MKFIDIHIECKSRNDRFELFPLYDAHIGKRNCSESALKKDIAEILRRSKLPNRHVRAFLGGDQIEAVNPKDIRRFDFDSLADWFVVPSETELAKALNTREVAAIIKAKLSNIANQEVKRAVSIFSPIKHLLVGAIHGNHETQFRKHYNVDVHVAICEGLGIPDLTGEFCMRVFFKRAHNSSTVTVYARHGYGAGRTPGAEPNKLERMRREWEWADICFSGHSHTFCKLPPKPVLHLPTKGKLPNQLLQKYRFAANPGCWLLSHLEGAGSYESAKCYEATPMMTLKAVVWPFWRKQSNGYVQEVPKIELRDYPIL